MTVAEIKKIAAQNGIKVAGLKKAELVRAIQVQEGNAPCFASGQAADCGQGHCLWLAACE